MEALYPFRLLLFVLQDMLWHNAASGLMLNENIQVIKKYQGDNIRRVFPFR